MLSFAQKLEASHATQNIFLITGGADHTGKNAWYYVQLDPKKKPFFQHAIKAGNANLDDYGSILFSGYGETPPKRVRQRIKKEYGFES